MVAKPRRNAVLLSASKIPILDKKITINPKVKFRIIFE